MVNREISYLLTPWSRVLLERLTGFQPVTKFSFCKLYSVVKYETDCLYSSYKVNNFQFHFLSSDLIAFSLTSQGWIWNSGGWRKWEMNWEGDWHRGPTLISNLSPQGHMKARVFRNTRSMLRSTLLPQGTILYLTL